MALAKASQQLSIDLDTGRGGHLVSVSPSVDRPNVPHRNDVVVLAQRCEAAERVDRLATAGGEVIKLGAHEVAHVEPGAEDRFRVLVDTDQRAAAPVRALIRRVAGRIDVGTLLVRGSGPLCLPRLDRLSFRFGAPIPTTPWAGARTIQRHGRNAATSSKAEVEAHIDYLLSLRDGDPQRRLLPRAVEGVRTALGGSAAGAGARGR
jgi:hypothetical protein